MAKGRDSEFETATPLPNSLIALHWLVEKMTTESPTSTLVIEKIGLAESLVALTGDCN